MKNTVYIFLVFVLVFFLNLLLYIYVDSYRAFIKVLKYWSEQTYTWALIDDSYNIDERDKDILTATWATDDSLKLDFMREETVNENDTETTTIDLPTSTTNTGIVEAPDPTTQTVNPNVGWIDDIGRPANLWVVEKKILDAFYDAGYPLYQKADKDDLLDIAGEYPDEYLQYGKEGFDIYMLTTRKYTEVVSIFSVLEYEMPFSINATNSFWTQSFFINLDSNDNKVRFIFEYERKVFWIKLKESEYSTVKNILNTL